jgi:hypothetical protein
VTIGLGPGFGAGRVELSLLFNPQLGVVIKPTASVDWIFSKDEIANADVAAETGDSRGNVSDAT